MTTLQCEIEGTQAVGRALDAVSAGLSDLGKARSDTSQIVTAAARGRAPRRTGRLAASGRAGSDDKGAGTTFAVPYANPIHWGWRARKIKPQPFALSAAEATQPIWISRYEDNIQQIIRGEGLDG